jgi:hypothetical protein
MVVANGAFRMSFYLPVNLSSLLSLLPQQIGYEKDDDTLLCHYLFAPLLFLSAG